MRSLQQYREIYRKIADSLGYQGDSVELLVQLLANATYIEEVENISYMNEASFDKAVLMNSKIQKSMDLMYSVYRGNCPRVIIACRVNKFLQFEPYQKIAESSNFKLYYLGTLRGEDFINEQGDGTRVNWLDYVNYSQCLLIPDKTRVIYIVGFISSEDPISSSEIMISESTNDYFIPVQSSNLSNDVLVQLKGRNNNQDTWGSVNVSTRLQDHVVGTIGNQELIPTLFDLTTTDFGSRLYFHGVLESSDVIKYQYFRMTYRDSFQKNELSKLSIRGTTAIEENEDGLKRFLDDSWWYAPGLYILPESAPESLLSVHYNANRDRYVNSIVRSNTDVAALLKSWFPDRIQDTDIKVSDDNGEGKSIVELYYVPTRGAEEITVGDRDNFETKMSAYYISDDIEILRGFKREILVTIDVKLYQTSSTLLSEIEGILGEYQYKFNTGLSDVLGHIDEDDYDIKDTAIWKKLNSTISKLPDVEYIQDIRFSKITQDENTNDDLEYFVITVQLNASV